MKKTKLALMQSAIALLLCFSMLMGTTYAWFTDSVTSNNNVIVAGNLDVELQYSTDFENWSYVNSESNIFDTTLWEPGHTEVVYLKVMNAGNLALQYRLGVNIVSESGSVNQAGENFLLSDYIQFGAVTGVTAAYATRGEARNAVATAQKISAGFQTTGSIVNNGADQYVALVVWMPEDVGNVANYATGMNPPEIKLGINLYATQEMDESDSFNDEYDNNAAADFYDGFQGGSAGAVVTTNDQGVTTAAVDMAGGDVSAVIPAGVQLADGKNSLALTVSTKESSEANIQLNENDEMRPLDVHIEGVGADNTVPMLITLKQYLTTGINTGALRLYHVENGSTVAMTQVANPVNHNEFSYDPLTGDVTLALASFSEVAVVADTKNTWDGTVATAFAGGSGTEANPYLIANADQLAFFRDVVDGKVEGWTEKTTFEGRYVQLENHIYLSNVLFDPIGWGYEYNDWNVGDEPGKPFKGTFNGNGKIIFDLYQNGWDLTNDVTGEAYTYTNCGFGLFAAAANATFKNLTIYGADIRVECVETGILVGLSQGSCTYENISIQHSKAANYQRPVGGLIGEVSPLNGGGVTTITDVEIGADVVVGSLWGDFDAPCGGVIGARWDDSNTTKVNMTRVKVHCRMDVYSDVTSAYQWYAYRRAGMLIGNTELTDPENQHLAYAKSFLTCKDVEVCYGDWVNYTYYQFTNQENTWCNNYPWVRAEVGENCSAFSNPRYGQPVVNGGITINSQQLAETHKTDYVEIPFAQLYGGGQGVYGQSKHEGVTVADCRYTITYINDGKVLSVKYVTDNTVEVPTTNAPAQHLVELWGSENIEGIWSFDGWMNAGSTVVEKIRVNNTENIVLYPYFENLYTAMFVDQQGNVLDWMLFRTNEKDKLVTMGENLKNEVPVGEHTVFDYWEVHITNDKGETTYTAKLDEYAVQASDIAIYPVYKYNGNLKMTPVDTDGDGKTNYYQVDGLQLTTDEYNKLTTEQKKAYMNVTIPAYVNGVPVTAIADDAFSDFADLEVINLPKTITYIGENAFVKKRAHEQITINYSGTKSEWNAIEDDFNGNWDKYVGTGSHIYFSDGSSYERKGVNGVYSDWY